MKNMNKKCYPLLLSAALLAGACNDAGQGESAAGGPVCVKTMAVAAPTGYAPDEYQGTVEEANGTDLSFATMGTVSSIRVNMGDRVAKGQLIATLDATTARSTHEAALAALARADDAFGRMRQLHDNGSLPELEFLIGTGGRMEAVRQPLTLGADNVTTRLDSLTPGTAYSYCLKAFDGHNNTYSDTMTFVTLPNNKPSVTQPKLYSQGPTSMIASYSVTDNGGEPLTATGFCVTNTATGGQRRIEADGDINADTTPNMKSGPTRPTPWAKAKARR